MRMVLPQLQSLLSNESTSSNVDNSAVASSAHDPVQPAVAECEEEWVVDQILDCRRFRGKLRYLDYLWCQFAQQIDNPWGCRGHHPYGSIR